MSDYVQLNDTNELPSFLLNPDVNNTANVTQNRCCGPKLLQYLVHHGYVSLRRRKTCR
jgi:hypothetical protein